jgi:hypothetical protein
MIDAYRIGVTIAMQGGLSKAILKIAEDFEKLDQALNNTKARVDSLETGLKRLVSVGDAAAAAWSKAAAAMERAAAAVAKGPAPGWSQPPQAGTVGGGRRAQSAATAAAAAAAVTAAQIANRSLPVPYSGGPGPARGRFPDEGGPTIPLPYGTGRGIVPYQSAPPSSGYQPTQPEYFEGDIIPPAYPGSRIPIGGAGGGGGMVPPGGPGGPGGAGGGGQQLPLNSYTYQPGQGPNLKQMGALNTLLPDYLGFEFLKHNWEEAAKFDAEKSFLVAQGFTKEQANLAGTQAIDLQKKVGAFTPEAGLHLINKLMNVTQDKNVALDPKLQEQYAKTSVVLSGYGHGGELGEIDAAIRGGEFRGVLTHEGKDGKPEIDTAGLTNFLKQLSAMAAISGGDIGPSKVLTAMRAMGTAGSIISPAELTRMMALMIASGSAKAGSNLQAFEQQFMAGRMSEGAANLLTQMGIITGGPNAKHNPELLKMGIGQFLMLPGAMDPKLQMMAATDGSQFITQVLLPKFVKAAKKDFGPNYENADEKGKLVYETKYASMVASRIGGGVHMAESIRNLFLMERDEKAAEEAMKRNLYENQKNNNPLFQSQSLGAANQSFSISLGEATMEPAAHALNALTSALNGLATWTTTHEELTKTGLEALAGALIALGAVGFVALSASLGGLTGILIGIGAAAGAATNGLSNLDNFLHTKLGWLLGTPEEMAKQKESMDKNGVTLPWWLPLPSRDTVRGGVGAVKQFFGFDGVDTSAPGGRSAGPGWAPFGGLLGPSPYPPYQDYGIPAGQGLPFSAAAPGGGKSASPIGSGPSGPSGTNSDPIVVHVQNQISEHGIAAGVSTRQSIMFNKPPGGYTGTDPRMDPIGAMNGWSPP